jgi:hypothetical protein
MVQRYIYIIYTLESLNTDNTPINFTYAYAQAWNQTICTGNYRYQVGFYGAYPNLNK